MSFLKKEDLLTNKVQKDGYVGVLKCLNSWKEYDVYSPYRVENEQIQTPQYYILIDKNGIERSCTNEEFIEIEKSNFYSLYTAKEKYIESFVLEVSNFISSKEIYKYTNKNNINLAYEKLIKNTKSNDNDIIFSKNICLANNNFENQLLLLMKDWKYTNYNVFKEILNKEYWSISILFSNGEKVKISGNMNTPKEYKQIKSLFNEHIGINNFVNP